MGILTKRQVVKLQKYIAALAIVGLPTDKAKVVFKFYQKIYDTYMDILKEQKALLDKFAVKVSDTGEIVDTTTENYKRCNDVYLELSSEEIDLSDFCTLTEEEFFVAVSRIDAPVSIIRELEDLLVKKEKSEEIAK